MDIAEGKTLDIRACHLKRGGGSVHRHHIDIGVRMGNAERDRPAAGPQVQNAAPARLQDVPQGLLDQQLVQISVEAEATAIPPGVEVNVEGMEIGASVHAGDLELPPGVTLDDEPDLLVLHVTAAPTAAQIEAELGLEAEEAEEVPGAVGEAAEGAAEAPPAESSGE